MRDHPFDRYSQFIDIDALKEYSQKPLRKCLRVNTLKMSVEEFIKYAKGQSWKLEPVEWCSEGFFIDREDRSLPLGKDMLHMLGHTYMQEASSMLPVVLLDPKPGEMILDMASAPGSKSTQIAAKLKGKGLVVCNDMQQARINTLVTAIHRLGVTNAIVTKKMGQWFGTHMTGRFDKVLIDAPCTGQGTSRKDKNALTYCSEHSIGKNAKLQRELLEAAIHATKIGGTIVYSTCTLTPEENEDVVTSLLKKFEGRVEVVDPRAMSFERWDMSKAIEDSIMVQKNYYPSSSIHYPFLRVWPQTYNTEGFFCAVLRKTAPTLDAKRVELAPRQEEVVPKARVRDICTFLETRFGLSFKEENEVLLQSGNRLWVTTNNAYKFKLTCPHIAMGLPFGKTLTKSPVMLDHDMAILRGSLANKNVIELTDAQWNDILQGKDIDCDSELQGNILLRYNGVCVCRGRARDGRCKNHMPRWVVQMHT